MLNFFVEWHEDSSATLLGRITAKNGTGEYTGVPGEGNWLKQADIATITGKVFDLDGDTPATPTQEFDVTIATSVIDTPDASGEVWTVDSIGYNFQWNLPSTYVPSSGHRIVVEFKVTLVAGLGSLVFHGTYQGTVLPILSS